MLEYTLQDDGTLDTVVEVCCTCGKTWTERIDGEYASEYRDADGTMVFLDAMMENLGLWCECEEE